jgi:hypothetical protein
MRTVRATRAERRYPDSDFAAAIAEVLKGLCAFTTVKDALELFTRDGLDAPKQVVSETFAGGTSNEGFDVEASIDAFPHVGALDTQLGALAELDALGGNVED